MGMRKETGLNGSSGFYLQHSPDSNAPPNRPSQSGQRAHPAACCCSTPNDFFLKRKKNCSEESWPRTATENLRQNASDSSPVLRGCRLAMRVKVVHAWSLGNASVGQMGPHTYTSTTWIGIQGGFGEARLCHADLTSSLRCVMNAY